jgi:exopolyphosphatase/guanosine-5'-triphosphate,3'-diphosphate pyrophosphatase
MKFAAIDIGTNAVRLLLSRVYQNGPIPHIKKETLVRMPIRLGEDVFTDGFISKEKTERLVETMTAYNHLINAYQALDYLGYATSAMRDAANSREVKALIKKKAGINLEVIDGSRETEIICTNRPGHLIDQARSLLYIDVGGGSTELALLTRNRVRHSKSFNLGGIRILKRRDQKSTWEEMKQWLKKHARGIDNLDAIGSGGNINKIFRLSGEKPDKPLSYRKAKSIYEYLQTYSLEERIRLLNLRSDRADVIVPAARIYLSAMKWASIKQIYVPMAGLSDGMIRILYEKYANKNGSK